MFEVVVQCVVDTTRATVVVVCRIPRGGKCVNTRV